MKRWVYDIYLDDLDSGNLVGENCEDEDFETAEEARRDARGFIVGELCEEYNRKEEEFRIKCYQIEI